MCVVITFYLIFLGKITDNILIKGNKLILYLQSFEELL